MKKLLYLILILIILGLSYLKYQAYRYPELELAPTVSPSPLSSLVPEPTPESSVAASLRPSPLATRSALPSASPLE